MGAKIRYIYLQVFHLHPSLQIINEINISRVFSEMRYWAATIYTALVHDADLGCGVRVELPQCIRSKIIDKFPDPKGQYLGFEAVPGDSTFFEEEF